MPRLVAVSKKQPVEKVVWAYRQGVRHFGENYVSHLHKPCSRWSCVDVCMVYCWPMLETGAGIAFQSSSCPSKATGLVN